MTDLETLYSQLNQSKERDIITEYKTDKVNNSPHVVRSSLMDYLKTEFAYKQDWIHPVTFERHKHDTIKAALLILKETNTSAYEVLYAMWTTQKSAGFLADRFFYSATTIKRKWERAIDLVILHLFFSDLKANTSKILKLM